MLKNAKDSCAAEALEIATYTALARLARVVGDGKTERLAKSPKRTARQARKVPGVVRAEGTVKGAVASEPDLAIPNYDSLSADEVQDKLNALSQIDLAKVNAYERKNQNRSTVIDRSIPSRATSPGPGTTS